MTEPGTWLGACPDCEAPIRHADVVIGYRTGRGRDRFAERPRCLRVVHPE